MIPSSLESKLLGTSAHSEYVLTPSFLWDNYATSSKLSTLRCLLELSRNSTYSSRVAFNIYFLSGLECYFLWLFACNGQAGPKLPTKCPKRIRFFYSESTHSASLGSLGSLCRERRPDFRPWGLGNNFCSSHEERLWSSGPAECYRQVTVRCTCLCLPNSAPYRRGRTVIYSDSDSHICGLWERGKYDDANGSVWNRNVRVMYLDDKQKTYFQFP